MVAFTFRYVSVSLHLRSVVFAFPLCSLALHLPSAVLLSTAFAFNRTSIQLCDAVISLTQLPSGPSFHLQLVANTQFVINVSI